MGRFKVNNNINSLIIFDFDDTLGKTSARIKIKSTGEAISSSEMSRSFMNREDELDFSEFRSEDLIEPVFPNKRLINIFKQSIDLYGEENVVIVTARRNPNPIKQFLTMFSLPLVRIYFIADDSRSSSLQKKEIINRIVKQGKYNEVIVYDDAEENLLSISSLHSPRLNVICYKVQGSFITPFDC